MTLRTHLQKAASGLLRNRRLVRAPILIYRARLGFMFGSRVLMLQHRGRNTGRHRYVVLEVIDNPAPNEYVVASGFGRRAQWYRNIRHDPHVRVTIGSRRPVPAIARPLDAERTRRALQRYATRHPRAWKQLKPVFEDVLGTPITADGAELPLVLLIVDFGADAQ